MIEPKILKGFRDSLPKAETYKQTLIDTIKNTFRLNGFSPIDTPALEYSDILLGKGGGETDKQVFRFKDNGDRDIALRFDHTVPLARFSALNYENLVFPLKCYQISKVWRGEKPQKGRFREFTQCDFDILGSDSIYSDFQVLFLIYKCFKNLNVDNFKIHISHRGLLNEYLKTKNIANDDNEILKILDKLKKIGIDKVKESLYQTGLSEMDVNSILDFISVKDINELINLIGMENEYLSLLNDVFDQIKLLNLSDYFVLDTSITRGLDYYTGIVFETFLSGVEFMGSVCSGGRYDNLSSLYINKKISGVGGSIGLDRLISALTELKKCSFDNIKSADFLITNQKWAFKLLDLLNKNNISSDIYCGNKSLGHQFAYAQQLSIPFVVFSYSEEKDKYSIKNIKKMEIYDDISFDFILGLSNDKT